VKNLLFFLLFLILNCSGDLSTRSKDDFPSMLTVSLQGYDSNSGENFVSILKGPFVPSKSNNAMIPIYLIDEKGKVDIPFDKVKNNYVYYSDGNVGGRIFIQNDSTQNEQTIVLDSLGKIVVENSSKYLYSVLNSTQFTTSTIDTLLLPEGEYVGIIKDASHKFSIKANSTITVNTTDIKDGGNSLKIGLKIDDLDSAKKYADLFDYQPIILQGGFSSTGWFNWNKTNGGYLKDFINNADEMGNNAVIIYNQLDGAGGRQFDNISLLLQDSSYMHNLFSEYVKVMKMIGKKNSIIIIEPYFLGSLLEYMQNDSTSLGLKEYVAVATSGETDVQEFENNIYGFIKALEKIRLSYAPNSKSSIYVTPRSVHVNGEYDIGAFTSIELDKFVDLWSSILISLYNDVPSINYLAIGARSGDAEYLNIPYWREKEYQNFLFLSKTLCQNINRPLLAWEIPVGYEGIGNGKNQHEDTFVDYFFNNKLSFENAGFSLFIFGSTYGYSTSISDINGIGDNNHLLELLQKKINK